MAPEREILKRKRSRPSDWWAANPSTPQQVDSSPKNSTRAPKLNPPERVIQNSAAAGNRRNNAKNLEEITDREIDVAEDELAKPPKRGRPPQSEDELRTSATSYIIDKPKKPDDAKRASAPELEVAGVSNQSAFKKRVRPTALKAEQGRDIGKDASQTIPKKRKRPSVSKRRVSDSNRRPLKESKNNEGRPVHAEEHARSRGRPRLTLRQDAREKDFVKEAPSSNHRIQRSHTAPPGQGPRDEEEIRGRRRTRQSDIAIVEKEVLNSSTLSDAERIGKKRKHFTDQEQNEERERGRKRTRKPNTKSNIPSTTKTTKIHAAQSRQDLSIIEIEAASSKLTKSRPKQKRVSNAVPVGRQSKGAGTSSSEKHSHISGISGITKSSVGQTIEPAKRRRVSKPIQTEKPESTPPADDLSYQHLIEVTKKVSRQTIEAKWGPLPSNSVDRISQILDDIQRPVIARLNDERKRTQASTAIQMVSRRLVSKISKGLPFPPATRPHQEDDFVFEKILDHNRSVEAQLTPALHANELLEFELSKELSWLESEKVKLAELEANAKTEGVLRNEAARKVNQVLQLQDTLPDLEGTKEDIGLVSGPYEESQASRAQLSNDEDVSLLIKEVEGHVESIHSNLKQVDGITAAMLKTKAVIQSTLYDHLDSAQYEEVVLAVD